MEYISPFEDDQEFSDSGCESGWTLYLGHDDSSISPRAISNQEHDCFGTRRNHVYDDEDEDEDLSMVSDASSGPPHLNEEDSYGSTGKDNNGGCFYRDEVNVNESSLSGKNLKRQKIEENRRRIKDIINKDQSSSNLLDDTASSPFFGFSNERLTHTRSRQAAMEINELDYSQGHSTTHFDGRAPNYHETYDFCQSGNQLYQNQWFGGKRW